MKRDLDPAELSGPDLDGPQWILKRVEEGTGGALPPGFPYIIDDASGEICEVALLFMTDKYMTDKGSFNENTVDGYTRDLLDYLRYCARFGIPWDKATYADLGRYVDSLNLVSPHLGKAADQTTVDRRLAPIRRMHEWASENLSQLLDDAPTGTLLQPNNVAHFLDDRRKELRYQLDFGDEATEDVSLPNVMQPHELAAALKAIGPAPVSGGSGGDVMVSESCIGHLGMDIGSQAGLRVGEVVRLRIKLFTKYAGRRIVPNRQYDIGPFPRKGGKRKLVKFHGVLLQKVLDYISCERASAMEGLSQDHGFLLVHLSGVHRGKKITPKTLQRRFARACIEAGLVRTVTRVRFLGIDATPTTVVEQRPAFTFHDLRHTFAVWMYYALKSAGDTEPWKYIQEQLGHEDVLTTIKTYLKVTQDFEAEASDKFVFTLNRMAGVGTGNESEEDETDDESEGD